MLICVDTINLVKRKHKHLKVQHSLTAKRSNLTRSVDAGRVSAINHELGKEKSFKWERDTTQKVVRVSQDLANLKTPVKAGRYDEDN
jgi:hypothetical protein